MKSFHILHEPKDNNTNYRYEESPIKHSEHILILEKKECTAKFVIVFDTLINT